MASILKVDTIQDQDGNNIINVNANTVTVGKSGDTVNIVGTATNFTSTGIDDNATSTAITIDSGERVGINETNPEQDLHLTHNSTLYMRAENTTLGCVTDFGTSSVGSTIINRSAHPMKFFTDSTERMSISGSGSVGIGTGVPSQALDVVGSIEVSDGIYIGGTGTANKLDDYEEGSWTPTYASSSGSFTSITYSIQSGTYTKVGRQVTCLLTLRTSAITVGTATDSLWVEGLPFTVSSNSSNLTYTPLGISYNFTNNPSTIRPQVGGTYLSVSKDFDNSILLVSDMGTGAAHNFIALEFTYFTD